MSTEKAYSIQTEDFSKYFYGDLNRTIDATVSNIENRTSVPIDKNKQLVVGIYSLLFAVGAVGNLTVFVALLKSRRRKSRVNLMMTHLAFADIIVTFILIPLEIGWRTTNEWLAGNLACKILLVLRAFGLYLSANVLVCISLDRFFAVLFPFRVSLARRRSKIMLAAAWGIAFVCSLPQSYVFRVLKHPQIEDFYQCVSFGAFSTLEQEQLYNIFSISAMYFAPLLVITFCYLRIYLEIGKNCKDMPDHVSPSATGRTLLRRSDQQLLERARSKTLKMTVTIVCVFFLCGLPYVIMALWYMFDRSTAEEVHPLIQDIFFIMAVSNSCMNPLVYGTYALNFKNRCLHQLISKFICRDSGNHAEDVLRGTMRSCNQKSSNIENVRKPILPIRHGSSNLCDHRFENSYVYSVIQSEPPLHLHEDTEVVSSRMKPSRSLDIYRGTR